MKAKIKYNNGWILEIPTTGNAPMLFLELISEFRSGLNPIQTIINEDVFKIRLNLTKTEIEKFAKYINSNV